MWQSGKHISYPLQVIKYKNKTWCMQIYHHSCGYIMDDMVLGGFKDNKRGVKVSLCLQSPGQASSPSDNVADTGNKLNSIFQPCNSFCLTFGLQHSYIYIYSTLDAKLVCYIWALYPSTSKNVFIQKKTESTDLNFFIALSM